MAQGCAGSDISFTNWALGLFCHKQDYVAMDKERITRQEERNCIYDNIRHPGAFCLYVCVCIVNNWIIDILFLRANAETYQLYGIQMNSLSPNENLLNYFLNCVF